MKKVMIMLAALACMATAPIMTSGTKSAPRSADVLGKKETVVSEKTRLVSEASDTLSGRITAHARISRESLFEKAVAMIKQYESLHGAGHWPYVGYGHRVRKGDGIAPGTVLSERQSDRLLRKDLMEYVKMYDQYGLDAVLLAALAYNCGHGRVNRSSVLAKLKKGDRDIKDAYMSHSYASGRFNRQLHERRKAEFSELFVP